MAYIDVLKQPIVGQVDSLIGISNNEIKQIEPSSLNEQLIIDNSTESIPEKWYTELINRVENNGPTPNILFKDDYDQYYSIFNISPQDGYIEVIFTSTYCADPASIDGADFGSIYTSSSIVTINEPVDGNCSVAVYSVEIDLQTGIQNTVDKLPTPVILVDGQNYDKNKVFNFTNDFTKGLKTNNIFLSVDNQLCPLSGFTANSTTYARLFFVSVPIVDGQAQNTKVYAVYCYQRTSVVTANVLNTRWTLPLCGYRSYFTDISGLEAGGTMALKDSPIWTATNCLTDGDAVWTKVPYITQEQLDAVNAKFKEAFPDINTTRFRVLFEYSGLTTPVGDDISNYKIAVYGLTVYRLP